MLKEILVPETCCDVVLSNMTKLLSTPGHFIARTVRKGRREWKYWDARRNLVIPHSFISLLRDTSTCAGALLPPCSGKSAFSHPITTRLNLARITCWVLSLTAFCHKFSQMTISTNLKWKMQLNTEMKSITLFFFYSHIWIHLRKNFKSTKLIKYLKILKYLTLA